MRNAGNWKPSEVQQCDNVVIGTPTIDREVVCVCFVELGMNLSQQPAPETHMKWLEKNKQSNPLKFTFIWLTHCLPHLSKNFCLDLDVIRAGWLAIIILFQEPTQQLQLAETTTACLHGSLRAAMLQSSKFSPTRIYATSVLGTFSNLATDISWAHGPSRGKRQRPTNRKWNTAAWARFVYDWASICLQPAHSHMISDMMPAYIYHIQCQAPDKPLPLQKNLCCCLCTFDFDLTDWLGRTRPHPCFCLLDQQSSPTMYSLTMPLAMAWGSDETTQDQETTGTRVPPPSIYFGMAAQACTLEKHESPKHSNGLPMHCEVAQMWWHQAELVQMSLGPYRCVHLAGSNRNIQPT